MENITDINQIKMAVLIKTAQYAFEGTLDEKQENIPYELTDPIKPNFRCCVYREREIIRQRVRLAMGSYTFKSFTMKSQTIPKIVMLCRLHLAGQVTLQGLSISTIA